MTRRYVVPPITGTHQQAMNEFVSSLNSVLAQIAADVDAVAVQAQTLPTLIPASTSFPVGDINPNVDTGSNIALRSTIIAALAKLGIQVNAIVTILRSVQRASRTTTPSS